MASKTRTTTASRTEALGGNWKAGVVGGLAGALVFGGLMAAMTPMVLEMGIPAMYGIVGPAGAAGFAIHMAHGAILGVVFAAVVGVGGLERAPAVRQVSAGVVYGLVLWVLLAVLVMPIWLGAVGFPGAPPLPNIGVESLVGHAVYGAVLGAVYYAVEDL